MTKCNQCKEELADDEGIWKFVNKPYCYDCISEYVRDECEGEAIDLWLDIHTEKIQ